MRTVSTCFYTFIGSYENPNLFYPPISLPVILETKTIYPNFMHVARRDHRRHLRRWVTVVRIFFLSEY